MYIGKECGVSLQVVRRGTVTPAVEMFAMASGHGVREVKICIGQTGEVMRLHHTEELGVVVNCCTA